MTEVVIRDIGRKMAFLAHRAAIEEIAEIQQRMVMRDGVEKRFGNKALPVREFTRRMLTGSDNQMLSVASQRRASEAESDERRLSELYVIVEELESLFAKAHDESMHNFMTAMSAHFRERTQGNKRNPGEPPYAI